MKGGCVTDMIADKGTVSKATSNGEEDKSRKARPRTPRAKPVTDVVANKLDLRLMKFNSGAQQGTDDRYFRLTRNIVYASRLWRKVANDAIRPYEQTMARLETLFLVAFSDAEVNQTDLAREINVEVPTIVRMLDKLATDGLISRGQSPTDLRVRVNRVTPKGEAVIEDLMAVTNEVRIDLLADIDTRKLDTCLEVIGILLKRLEARR
jgi:DNA-binding MarR family transcriptional regulator